MKYLNLTVLVVLFIALSNANCSKDDEPVAEQEILVGHWQIQTINFTEFVDDGFPGNDVVMLEGMLGYTFEADGNFIFEAESGYGSADTKYWSWSGDEKSFKINQINKSMPPYDFSLTPKNLTVEKVSNSWTMSFNADLSNGSKADFKLVKVETIDFSNEPEVTGVDHLVVGDWQLKKIDFTTFVQGGFPANDGVMLSGMSGYVFEADGNFIFVTGGSYGDETQKYWDWEGTPGSFKITQKNKSMPPYNFGITPKNLKIAEVGNVLTMSFSADLTNGSTADFQLEKVDQVNPDETPDITGN